MYLSARSQRTQLEQVIVRKDRDTRAWMSRKLEGMEGYNIVPIHNGLGLQVGIRGSIRAKELLLCLHRDVLLQFGEPTPSLDEHGVWSACFFFAEPSEPTNYVSAQCFTHRDIPGTRYLFR
jgi:hypothetical protein